MSLSQKANKWQFRNDQDSEMIRWTMIFTMNRDFHQITILLASMKNWHPPRVDSEILIEKTSVSSWVLAFPSVSISFRKRTCEWKMQPNETEVYFESFTKTQLYLL